MKLSTLMGGKWKRASQCEPGANPECKKGRSPKIPRWKRILDLGWIAISSPIWLLLMIGVAVGIKIVSRGPVLFRQERVGYMGKRFVCLKFRSMKADVDTGGHEGYLEHLIRSDSPMTKLDVIGDPRLHPLGQFIRATGLDELPQLINVIRGEMSLVGPRPCTPSEFRNYKPTQRERVNTLPGLTGYWQINGKNNTTFTQMIAMDLYYIKSMSPWLDLAILFGTVPWVIRQVFEPGSGNGLSRAIAKQCQ